MLIRPASLDDLHALAAMGSRFLAESPHVSICGMPAPHALLAALRHAIMGQADGSYDVLLAQRDDGSLVGFLIGAIVSPWWNASQRMASELAWWVDPSARRGRAGLSLLWQWLAQARDAGCELASVSTLDGVGMHGLPSRLGFAAVETGWMIRLADDTQPLEDF